MFVSRQDGTSSSIAKVILNAHVKGQTANPNRTPLPVLTPGPPHLPLRRRLGTLLRHLLDLLLHLLHLLCSEGFQRPAKGGVPTHHLPPTTQPEPGGEEGPRLGQVWVQNFSVFRAKEQRKIPIWGSHDHHKEAGRSGTRNLSRTRNLWEEFMGGNSLIWGSWTSPLTTAPRKEKSFGIFPMVGKNRYLGRKWDLPSLCMGFPDLFFSPQSTILQIVDSIVHHA